MVSEAIKVLITEDEQNFANLVQSMLSASENDSFLVDWVADLKTCLDSLDGNSYDILLLDLHLPDSLGLDTVRSVRQRFHQIPIVAMTGLKEVELARGALRAGAQDFFEKTEFSGKLLSRVIRYAIDRRSMELQLEQHAAELEVRVQNRTKELQSAKEMWEKTFNALPDLIAIIDKNHKIVNSNVAMAKAAGFAPGSLPGRYCFEVMHGTERPIIDCPHDSLLKDGKEHVLEYHEPNLGLDLLVSTSPLHDDQGNLLGSVHVARDVSLIKEAQRAIAESERQHRMFMDRLPDPTVVYDGEGKVIYLNAAFESVFGWSLDELRNRKVEFVPPDTLRATQNIIEKMMRGQSVADFETQRFTKRGEKLDVLINTAPLFDLNKKQTGNIVILRDMTAIRKAEEARKVTEHKFRDLVESMNEGLTMADQSGRIVYTNARFCTMLGYPVGGLAGMLFEDLLDESSRTLFRDRWAKRRSGEEKKYEVVFKTQDGGSVYAIVSPKILFDSQDNMAGSFAIVTDITERKNLESQLLQSQKLEGIGQLAAGIAHEINTPTQYVLNNTGFLEESFGDLLQLVNAHRSFAVDLMKRGIEQAGAAELEDLGQELDFDFLAEEIPNALESNREGLERISKIVLSIKEFAHPGQEKKQLADLNRAIENTITVARNEWKYVAKVETDLDPEMPPVPCVVGEINQVFLNLMVNAAQAIAEQYDGKGEIKGRIAISTKRNKDVVEIRIADNGPGIPEANLGRIFDPFFTTKEPGKGTGQGLAIAYRAIVINHHGELLVDSPEGNGTTFIIRLPLMETGAD